MCTLYVRVCCLREIILKYSVSGSALRCRIAVVSNPAALQIVSYTLCIALPLIDGLVCVHPNGLLPVYILVNSVYVIWMISIVINFVCAAVQFLRRIRRWAWIDKYFMNFIVLLERHFH